MRHRAAERAQRRDPRVVRLEVVAIDDEHRRRRGPRRAHQIDCRERRAGLRGQREADELVVAVGAARELQRAHLAHERLAARDRGDRDHAGDIFAPRRRERREARAEAHAREHDARGAAGARELARVVDAREPRGDAIGIAAVARAVARAIEIELHRDHAGRGGTLAEHAQRTKRAHRLVAERRHDHEPDAGRVRRAVRRVDEREPRPLALAEKTASPAIVARFNDSRSAARSPRRARRRSRTPRASSCDPGTRCRARPRARA